MNSTSKIELKITNFLEFEKSGEKFRVTIELENISPDIKMDTLKNTIKVLSEDAQNNLFKKFINEKP